MSLRRRVLQGGLLLGGGNALNQILRLIRNVIVARILTPEDFGVAATFWITTGFLATISELGFSKLLIQAREGDDERFGGTVQLMMAIRGFLIGAVIFLLAEPVAAMFRVPQAAWAFRWVAILPVLHSLRHRDVVRLQRKLHFVPSVSSQVGPAVVTALLAWPIAKWVGDYSAFVWLSIVNAVLAVLISHLLAEHSFRMVWDQRVIRRALDFGWPLLINGLLMFAALQGDRVILSRAYTKAELGVYSVAIGLAMTPCGIVSGITGQVMLPLLSRAQNDRKTFQRHYRLYVQLAGAAGLVVGGLFLVLGPVLINVLYGPKYELAGVVIGWLAARQSIRLLRGALNTSAIALGDTRTPLIANVFRQAGLGMALIAALAQAPLRWIAIAGVAGESVALSAFIVWVRWRHKLPIRFAAVPVVVLVGGLLLSAWIGMFGVLRDSLPVAAVTFVVVSGASCAVVLIVFADLRDSYAL